MFNLIYREASKVKDRRHTQDIVITRLMKLVFFMFILCSTLFDDSPRIIFIIRKCQNLSSFYYKFWLWDPDKNIFNHHYFFLFLSHPLSTIAITYVSNNEICNQTFTNNSNLEIYGFLSLFPPNQVTWLRDQDTFEMMFSRTSLALSLGMLTVWVKSLPSFQLLKFSKPWLAKLSFTHLQKMDENCALKILISCLNFISLCWLRFYPQWEHILVSINRILLYDRPCILSLIGRF